MPELSWPPSMAALRSNLGSIVADLETRVPYAAVLASARSGTQITVDHREETVSELPRTAGTVVTVYDGAALHESAVSGFDRLAVAQAVRDLASRVQVMGGRTLDPGPARTGDFQTPNGSLSTHDKLERVRDIQHRLHALEPRLVNVRVSYADQLNTSVFRNRTADLAQSLELARITVIAMAAGPNGVQFDIAYRSGLANWDGLTFTDDDLQQLADNALALLTAERIEPGEYAVVMSPGVSGTLAHESFGHGVETDMFLKQRARAAQYIEREVGSPLVNIVDDPSVPNQSGSYFFDDEGQLAAPTHIVEQGVFKRGLTDLYSAAALNVSRSANGRRQDYSRKAYARMSNTFFAPGTTPVGDLITQVDHGVYLQQWYSGMEDPQGWGIQITCLYGREIKHGQVTDHIFAPIVMTGYVPDVLRTVSAVGSDFELSPGRCGKGHKEIVFVSAGGPHLLLKARLS